MMNGLYFPRSRSEDCGYLYFNIIIQIFTLILFIKNNESFVRFDGLPSLYDMVLFDNQP